MARTTPLEKRLRTESGPSKDDDVAARCTQRARRMLSDALANNPLSHAMIVDPSPHVSAVCPRRAGKTYAAVLAALITGEAKPGSITIIISLNLKQLRRLYWTGGPSGLFTVARKYGLNIKFNGTHLTWEHENGSIGYLLGADDDEQLEVIRGLEADLYIIDECKSFAPAVLETLIDDILDPQRESRRGRILMIGTPGYVFDGPFYRATCPGALDSEGRPYLIGLDANYQRVAVDRDAWGRSAEDDLLWSAHHWTLADNKAMPHQWTGALKKKRSMGWDDNHPTWVREYLGRWTKSLIGLVYRYLEHKGGGLVTWIPDRTADNPTGLPEAGAPWHLIGGIDLGYEAPTAFVLCAYSTVTNELRHVEDWSARHLLPTDIAERILSAQDKYGPIEVIFADTGNLGKMIVSTLVRDYGLPLEHADKREKYDHIELVNDALAHGWVKIIERSILEHQLLTDAWNFRNHPRAETDDKVRIQLARRGKLVEDDTIPNDSADAFLYCFRGAYLRLNRKQADSSQPPPGSVDWWKAWERRELERARREIREQQRGVAALGSNNIRARAPRGVLPALQGGAAWFRRMSSKIIYSS